MQLADGLAAVGAEPPPALREAPRGPGSPPDPPHGLLSRGPRARGTSSKRVPTPSCAHPSTSLTPHPFERMCRTPDPKPRNLDLKNDGMNKSGSAISFRTLVLSSTTLMV